MAKAKKSKSRAKRRTVKRTPARKTAARKRSGGRAQKSLYDSFLSIFKN